MENITVRKKALTPDLLEECQKLKAIFESKKRMLLVSQGSIAEEMGINQSSVSHYLNGINALNANAAAKFASILEVDVADFSPRLAKELDDLIKAAIPNNDSVRSLHKTYRYPVVSWVSAGSYIESLEPEYKDDFINTDINAGEKGFWLKIKGDSMSNPNGITFPENMYILVSPNSQIFNGCFVVAKITETNETTFKQYVEEAGIKYLKPLNAAYKMQELDERWQLVGKVVDARWRLN